MAIDEEARQELYRALETALGHGPATTLMDRLAFEERFSREIGQIHEEFGRVHHEFGRLRQEFGLEFGAVRQEIGEIHLRIAEWGRTLVLANVATMVAAVSLAFAASRL